LFVDALTSVHIAILILGLPAKNNLESKLTRNPKKSSGKFHLVRAVEGSLKRLGAGYIDLFQLHGFDAMTPIEETLVIRLVAKPGETQRHSAAEPQPTERGQPCPQVAREPVATRGQGCPRSAKIFAAREDVWR
jgi:hypothetical protein